MNKKLATIIIVFILTVFLGFIVYDVAFKGEDKPPVSVAMPKFDAKDMWTAIKVFEPGYGKLKAVAVMSNGNIILGGDSFISAFDSELKPLWNNKTEVPVTGLSVWGDSVFASTQDLLLILNSKGEKLNEWGPFEDRAIITSVSSNRSYVAFADAGNRLVFILDKKGNVKYMVGQSGEPFIIPSPYFDVALSDNNTLFVANTGNRRIETRNINGTLLGYFGEPGIAPGAFCGCCNPAHFALVPGGFVTAEKGINRIKLLNEKGEFTEFVSSINDFVAPLPLDIASADGKTIYGANPADNKLYVFKRK
jgi:hypothetical protein